jgi:hypothetical protein
VHNARRIDCQSVVQVDLINAGDARAVLRPVAERPDDIHVLIVVRPAAAPISVPDPHLAFAVDDRKRRLRVCDPLQHVALALLESAAPNNRVQRGAGADREQNALEAEANRSIETGNECGADERGPDEEAFDDLTTHRATGKAARPLVQRQAGAAGRVRLAR